MPYLLLGMTNSKQFRGAFITVTSLFFMWGFITVLVDALIPRLKDVFELTYLQAGLVQFAWFTAYGVISIPGGRMIKRIGYKNGIMAGLSLAAIGCLIFYPAASTRLFPLFLLALFVVASGPRACLAAFFLAAAAALRRRTFSLFSSISRLMRSSFLFCKRSAKLPVSSSELSSRIQSREASGETGRVVMDSECRFNKSRILRREKEGKEGKERKGRKQVKGAHGRKGLKNN